jgi:hypothetical protein
MGGDHSDRSAVVAGRIGEGSHCDICTDYNSLGYGREVAGWPSLQMNDVSQCSERVTEHIRRSPELQSRRAESECLRQRTNES